MRSFGLFVVMVVTPGILVVGHEPRRKSLRPVIRAIGGAERRSQESEKQPLEMSIRPRRDPWDSRSPLLIDVVFTNRSRSSLFVNFRSAFEFQGSLTDRTGQAFYVDLRPEGENRAPVKSDYEEMAPGATRGISVTSRKISSAVGERSIPWRRRKKGLYELTIHFLSGGKYHAVENSWEGTPSATTTIYLR